MPRREFTFVFRELTKLKSIGFIHMRKPHPATFERSIFLCFISILALCDPVYATRKLYAGITPTSVNWFGGTNQYYLWCTFNNPSQWTQTVTVDSILMGVFSPNTLNTTTTPGVSKTFTLQKNESYEAMYGAGTNSVSGDLPKHLIISVSPDKGLLTANCTIEIGYLANGTIQTWIMQAVPINAGRPF